MAHSVVFEGIYVPIAAPFDAADVLDLAAYGRVVDYCLGAGVRGLVPNGTTGEYYAMTFDERIQVLTHCRDAANGRAQLIAGCNAGSTKECIRYASVARELGYDAIMLAAPPTSLPSQRELAAHFIAVAEGGGLPVVLYNYPARAGVEIGFECLDAIADRADIIAIKESSSDFSRFLAMRRRYGNSIQIMCGSDDQAADYFAWGVRSWLAGTANVLPRQHVEVLEASLRGDHAEAMRRFDLFLPWVQNMEEGSYNQKIKLGLERVGIPMGSVRPPLLPVAAEVAKANIAALDAALAATGGAAA
jgi:4-hydroxy-tetrahydrodipicolinate synthase